MIIGEHRIVFLLLHDAVTHVACLTTSAVFKNTILHLSVRVCQPGRHTMMYLNIKSFSTDIRFVLIPYTHLVYLVSKAKGLMSSVSAVTLGLSLLLRNST